MLLLLLQSVEAAPGYYVVVVAVCGTHSRLLCCCCCCSLWKLLQATMLLLLQSVEPVTPGYYVVVVVAVCGSCSRQNIPTSRRSACRSCSTASHCPLVPTSSGSSSTTTSAVKTGKRGSQQVSGHMFFLLVYIGTWVCTTHLLDELHTG